MGIEIERKFLVIGEDWRREADGGTRIRQAYLANGTGTSVRVRCAADRAWITVKGERDGIVRPEFEYEIPADDAEAMLTLLCEGPVLEKVRYRIVRDGMVWEVDRFEGTASGLVIAEVELSSAEQSLVLPDWIGDEVSHDARYRNTAIARNGPPRPIAMFRAPGAA